MPVTTLPEGETDEAVRDAAAQPDRDFNAAFGEMTHAVLNALNAVTAAAELSRLLLKRHEADEASKTMARVEPECLRAARLLRDGRAYLTFRLQTLQAVDVIALLNACAETFAGRVEVLAGDERPAVRGDADALRRVFAEFLENAFAFGANHVRVTPTEPEEGVLRIDFLDDGPGVRAPAARLFAPFFTTSSDEHSGLGLALAAQVAEAHRGRVGVSDSAGGALFWIELPLHEA